MNLFFPACLNTTVTWCTPDQSFSTWLLHCLITGAKQQCVCACMWVCFALNVSDWWACRLFSCCYCAVTQKRAGCMHVHPPSKNARRPMWQCFQSRLSAQTKPFQPQQPSMCVSMCVLACLCVFILIQNAFLSERDLLSIFCSYSFSYSMFSSLFVIMFALFAVFFPTKKRATEETREAERGRRKGNAWRMKRRKSLLCGNVCVWALWIWNKLDYWHVPNNLWHREKQWEHGKVR